MSLARKMAPDPIYTIYTTYSFSYGWKISSDAVVAYVKERHVLARTIHGNKVHFDITDFEDIQYKLPSCDVTNVTATATVQTQIDKAISGGQLLVLLFHKIVDADADLETKYLTDDFETISNYLKTKQDAGDLEVITFSDYYDALTADWITVDPTSGLTTTEAGGTDTFTVVLTSEPTADVTIGLSSSDTTEGTVSSSSLTFTSANWSTSQTVTITGVNDNVNDGNIAYTIVTAAASSSDSNYNNLDADDVSATNSDDDAGGGGLPSGAYNPPTSPAPTPENPQGGFKVLINDGAQTANSRTVTLKLFAGSDTKRMAISRDPDFALGADTGQISYQSSYAWDLCYGQKKCPSGAYIVYVKFYTQYGQSSEVVSDMIVLGGIEAEESAEEMTKKEILFKMVEILKKVIQIYTQLIQILKG
ncbi:hypothetical protein KJ841_00110 [Patescibacteria group bacterium]|nr:hypothetical protein [Patescibacteria group bacterium]